MVPSLRSLVGSDRAAPVVALLLASVVLVSVDARADDELASCVTRTARAPDEILVPTGDSPDSPLGVSIVAGETLCLSGTVTRGVLTPRLADPEHGEAAILRLHLEPSDAATTLTVTSVCDRELAYDAAIVSGPANLAMPAPGRHLAPGSTIVQALGPAARRLLLHRLRLIEPPPPPPPMELVPLAERWGQVTLDPLVGARRLSVAAFDAPLRASGYGPLPRTYVGGGFALDFSLARWRFGLQMLYGVGSAPSYIDGSSVGASVGDVSFTFGYDLVRWEGLSVFALASVGISALMMDTRDPHWTYVAHRTGVGSDVSTVEQDSALLGGQVGLEQLVPLGRASAGERYALVLSLRGGYEQQFANLGWQTSNSDSKSLGGLPLVDLGGGWMALGIGLGVYSTGWRQVGRAAP